MDLLAIDQVKQLVPDLLNNIVRTDELTEHNQQAAINQLYAASGLNAPNVHFVASPLAAHLLLVERIAQGAIQSDYAVIKQLKSDVTERHAPLLVDWLPEYRTRYLTSLIDQAIRWHRQRFGQSLLYTACANERELIRSSVDRTVWQQLWDLTHNQAKPCMTLLDRCIPNALNDLAVVNPVYIEDTVDYALSFWGTKAELLVWKHSAALCGVALNLSDLNIAVHLDYIIPFEDVCICSAHPIKYTWADQNPMIEWSDGFKIDLTQ